MYFFIILSDISVIRSGLCSFLVTSLHMMMFTMINTAVLSYRKNYLLPHENWELFLKELYEGDDFMSEVMKEADRINDEYKTFISENFEISNGEFMLFQNFIDALTKGRLGTYYYIKRPNHTICVHNEEYFNKYDYRQFAEMLADYIALKRSPNGQYYITILANIFDDKLIEIMDDYYDDISLNSPSLNKPIIKKKSKK